MAFGFVYPIPGVRPDENQGVDQGVDYDPHGNVLAIGPGYVYHISPPGSFDTPYGTGEAVYERLDTPVTIGGHIYSNIYYSEQRPLVGLGHIAAGTPVMGPGEDELGFASDVGHAPHDPRGGATTAGYDFLSFMRTLAAGGTLPPPTPPFAPSPSPSPAPKAAPPSGGNGKGQAPGTVPPKADGSCPPGSTKIVPGSPSCKFWPQTCGQCSTVSGFPSLSCGGIVPQGICDALAFLFSLRFLEVVFGGMLVLLGIYLVVRQMGQEIGIKLPGPVEAAGAIATRGAVR